MKNIFGHALKSLSSALLPRAGTQAAEKMDCSTRMKEKYYRDLETMYEQYDVFLHDIKHMLRAIHALSKEGDCEKIGQLIEGLGTSLGNIEQGTICSHHILNAVLSERKGYADDRGVTLKIDIKEPLYLQNIDDIDLITFVGNLLDNAMEAEEHAEKQEGVLCSIAMARGERHIVFMIENSYDKRRMNGRVPGRKSNRIGDKHGIGLKSVRKVIEKYGGIMETDDTEGRYRVKIILPVQEKASRAIESTIA